MLQSASFHVVAFRRQTVEPVQGSLTPKNPSADPGRWQGSAGDRIKGPLPTNPVMVAEDARAGVELRSRATMDCEVLRITSAFHM